MEDKFQVWDNSFPKEEEPKEEVKCMKPRASVPLIFEVFAFSKPKEELQETSDDLETYYEKKVEESNDSKLTKVDEDIEEPKKDEKKAKAVRGKSKGVKRKHELNANKKKIGNSKKSYKRRVVAYKRKKWRLK